MDLIEYSKKGIDIALLKKEVIEEVAKDRNATLPATIFLIIGLSTITIVNAILSNYTTSQIIYDIIFGSIFLTFLFYLATHILARLFGSRNKFVLFYRAFTLTYIINLLGVFALIPKISILIYIILLIWGITINYFVIKETYKLSKGRIIGLLAILLLMIVIFSIISYIIALIIGIETLPTG